MLKCAFSTRRNIGFFVTCLTWILISGESVVLFQHHLHAKNANFSIACLHNSLVFFKQRGEWRNGFFSFLMQKSKQNLKQHEFLLIFYYKNDKDILLRGNQQTSVFPRYKITKKYQGVQRSTKKYMYVSTGVIMIKTYYLVKLSILSELIVQIA